jgi:NADH-quinone oxidoreductase subunit J
MTLEVVLFWLVALLTVGCAVGVAVTQNITRAAVWLLFTLSGTAGLFFLLGADFVGAAQLMTYVGGVLILVIFGVMLTAQGPFVNLKTPAGEWAMSLIVGMLLLGLVGLVVLGEHWGRLRPTNYPSHPAEARNSNDIGLGMIGVTQASPAGKLPAVPERERTAVGYLFPFQILAVHLVVVLIGAAYLARAKRRRRATS